MKTVEGFNHALTPQLSLLILLIHLYLKQRNSALDGIITNHHCSMPLEPSSSVLISNHCMPYV